MSDEEKVLCDGCGKELDSFACRIRHIHMNTGDANMARQYNEQKRIEKQIKDYGV